MLQASHSRAPGNRRHVDNYPKIVSRETACTGRLLCIEIGEFISGNDSVGRGASIRVEPRGRSKSPGVSAESRWLNCGGRTALLA